MKIEEGKFYVTRDGREVGPMRELDRSETDYPWIAQAGGFVGEHYNVEGVCSAPYGSDLVSEWVEPVAANAQPKFKVGDRVRRITKSIWPAQFGEVGREYTVLEVTLSGSLVVVDGAAGASASAFTIVSTTHTNDNSPIRTVTRREIVLGVYDGVCVYDVACDEVWVEITGYQTPVKLREAAHLFNQLAEVLEEQAREAA